MESSKMHNKRRKGGQKAEKEVWNLVEDPWTPNSGESIHSQNKVVNENFGHCWDYIHPPTAPNDTSQLIVLSIARDTIMYVF